MRQVTFLEQAYRLLPPLREPPPPDEPLREPPPPDELLRELPPPDELLRDEEPPPLLIELRDDEEPPVRVTLVLLGRLLLPDERLL